MGNNIQALNAAIKLVADIANDALNTTGVTVINRWANLLPDIMTLLPSISDLPAEAKALQAEDYETLLNSLAGYLNLGSGKAEAVLQASVKLLADLQKVILPDVEALIAATK